VGGVSGSAATRSPHPVAAQAPLTPPTRYPTHSLPHPLVTPPTRHPTHSSPHPLVARRSRLPPSPSRRAGTVFCDVRLPVRLFEVRHRGRERQLFFRGRCGGAVGASHVAGRGDDDGRRASVAVRSVGREAARGGARGQAAAADGLPGGVSVDHGPYDVERGVRRAVPHSGVRGALQVRPSRRLRHVHGQGGSEGRPESVGG